MATPASEIVGRAMTGIEDVVKHHIYHPLDTSAIKDGMKQTITQHGTGSMVIDGLIGGLKKVPGINKHVNDKSVSDALYKAQSKMHDVDLKGGNYVADKLGDEHPRLKKLFSSQEKIHVGDSTLLGGKKVPLYEEASSHRLSSPLEKAKHVAAPLLAGMAISDIVRGGKSETGTGQAKQASNEYREQLIEKIALAVSADKDSKTNKQPSGNLPKVIKADPLSYMGEREYMQKAYGYSPEELKKVSVELEKKDELLARAGDGLRKAASLIRERDESLAKVAKENKKLELQIIASQRSKKAVELATTMQKKGLIKKAGFNEKVDQIMDMDESSHQILKDTVEKVASTKQKVSEGLESLAFVLGDNHYTETKKTLAESISE